MERIKQIIVAVLRRLKLKPPPPVEETGIDEEAAEAFLESISENERSLSDAAVRAALITSSAGVPNTLASTNYSLSIIEGMLQNGVDVRFLATQQLDLPVLDDDLLLSDIFLPAFWRRSPSGQFVRDVFSSQEFDFVLNISTPVSQMRAQAQLVRAHGAVYVHFSGESPIRVFPAEEKRQEFVRLVRESSDGIFTVSDYLRDYWIEQGFSKEKIFVMRVPVRENLFPDNVDQNAGKHAVYVGNLSHGEIDDLMIIAQSVVSEIEDFSLSLFADAAVGRQEELQRRIVKMELENNVSIHPPLPLKDLAEIEANADVLLLPRRRGEFSKAGFPNKMGEYLMSGTPVVCSDVGEIRAIIGDKSAFFVEADKPDLFAKQLISVLSDPSTARKVGQAGRAWAMEHVGSYRIARAMLVWLDNLRVKR